MGVFLINVFGWIAVGCLLMALLGLAYRFAPHEAKTAFARTRVATAWDDILHDLANDPKCTMVSMPVSHRNVSDIVVDAIADYVQECLGVRTREAFEDIELPEGYYLSGVRHTIVDDALVLSFDVKRGDKKYSINHGVFKKTHEFEIPS